MGFYLWSKYRFKLSPSNENGGELFSMIVHTMFIIEHRDIDGECKHHKEHRSDDYYHYITLYIITVSQGRLCPVV